MKVTVQNLEQRLGDVGYIVRREELLAVSGALAVRGLSGSKAILLEGPPGCGKTFLAEALSEAIGAHFVFQLFHSWTGDEELFRGVDVGAAVAGDAKNVHQDGVLARAAKASRKNGRLVVVCLDEVDKCPERTEALLLDWLQTGRVPVKPGEHILTKLDRVVVFLTTNGMRELTDPLMRRCRRVQMQPLPDEICSLLISQRAKVPKGVAKLCWMAMRKVAKADKIDLSVQEGVRCAAESVAVAGCADDLRSIISGWAARGEEGRKAANDTGLDLNPLWGEIKRFRDG